MNKINTKFSAQEKSKLNARKITDWLSARPIIPVYHGKVNKTAICKMHGIPKSTIDTNRELQQLFAPDGPIEALAAEQMPMMTKPVESTSTESAVHQYSLDSYSALIEQIQSLRVQLNSIRLDLASEEFLLATGRYIPRLYNRFEDK